MPDYSKTHQVVCDNSYCGIPGHHMQNYSVSYEGRTYKVIGPDSPVSNYWPSGRVHIQSAAGSDRYVQGETIKCKVAKIEQPAQDKTDTKEKKTMSSAFSSFQDVIPASDIKERIEEIGQELADGEDVDTDELIMLLKIKEDITDNMPAYTDWEDITLIREGYSEDYLKCDNPDLVGLPDDLSSLVENNLDWSGIAEDFFENTAEITLPGDFGDVKYLVWE